MPNKPTESRQAQAVETRAQTGAELVVRTLEAQGVTQDRKSVV